MSCFVTVPEVCLGFLRLSGMHAFASTVDSRLKVRQMLMSLYHLAVRGRPQPCVESIDPACLSKQIVSRAPGAGMQRSRRRASWNM